MRLTKRAVRRTFGISWWEWVRFRWSRPNRRYLVARRRAERDRRRFVAEIYRRAATLGDDPKACSDVRGVPVWNPTEVHDPAECEAKNDRIRALKEEKERMELVVRQARQVRRWAYLRRKKNHTEIGNADIDALHRALVALERNE